MPHTYAAEGIGFCVCVLFLYPIREATRRRLGNLPLTLVVSFLAITIFAIFIILQALYMARLPMAI